ncbi:MAG TPA: autotransporter domain-containing protein [Geobacteraceae bacterium]
MGGFIRSVVALLVITAAPPAFAARIGDVDELTTYLSIANFSWQETLNGQRALKESGPVAGVGATGAVVVATPREGSVLRLRGRAEIFGGDVDYDGQTAGSNPTPVHTDTTYFGVKGEGEIGFRITSGRSAIEPFAGLGYRWWRRDISDSTTRQNGADVAVAGSLELWQSLYTKVGLRATHEVASGFNAFAEAGALYPFLNRNTAKDSTLGEPTVEPEGAWSAFAELGLEFGKLRPSLFYEGRRFSRSPSVVAGNFVVFQPDSDEDIFGVRIGWAFR